MTMTLTEAKARLSEVVKSVRRDRTRLVITVDGEEAVVIAPVDGTPRLLSPREVAVAQALEAAVLAHGRASGPFDAVELIREGRR